MAIGANLLINNESMWPREVACAIVVFENYEAMGSIDAAINCHVASIRDLSYGGSSTMRDLLKFYRKRMPCSCLKRTHLEARKSLSKLGECCHCNRVMERVLLYVCGSCGVSQYCSKQCQVEHWPMHKSGCGNFCIKLKTS